MDITGRMGEQTQHTKVTLHVGEQEPVACRPVNKRKIPKRQRKDDAVLDEDMRKRPAAIGHRPRTEAEELRGLGVEVADESYVHQSVSKESVLEELLLTYHDLAMPTVEQHKFTAFKTRTIDFVLNEVRQQSGQAFREREHRWRRGMTEHFLFSMLINARKAARSPLSSESESEEAPQIVSSPHAASPSKQPIEHTNPVTSHSKRLRDEAEQISVAASRRTLDNGLAPDERRIRSVICPVCTRQIDVPMDSTADSVIDKHVDRCIRTNRSKSQRKVERSDSQEEEEDIDLEITPRQRYKLAHSSEEDEKASAQASVAPDLFTGTPTRQRLRRTDSGEPENEDTDRSEFRSGGATKRSRSQAPTQQKEELNDFLNQCFAKRIEALPEDDEIQLETSQSIYNRLMDHQREGIAWLWRLYNEQVGGILADEMGLGKTAQICVHFDSIRRHCSRIANCFLVVVPATVLRHWEIELHRWSPRIRVLVGHAMNTTFGAVKAFGQEGIERAIGRALTRNTSVAVVVTYEGLKRFQDSLLSFEWACVVLDEGHKIRNVQSQITSVCKQIASSHRLITSGTPIQNSLRELWCVFDFCYPGKLGELKKFEDDIVEPIRKGRYRNASQIEALTAVRTAASLQELLRPYLLRRKKAEVHFVTPLPEKTEQLSTRQKEVYRSVLNSIDMQKIHSHKNVAFSAINILRKLCNHPGFVYVNGEVQWEAVDEPAEDDPVRFKWDDSGKLVLLKRLLNMWHARGHRALVFSQTVTMLNLVQRMVEDEGFSFERLDGRTPVKKRHDMIQRFNEDSSIDLMLITTRTGGLGISLTGANRVVIIDPDWNPQTDVQAQERAWRIGQTKPVTTYRLVTRGTIEEKVYKKQVFKTLLSNQILENPRQQRLFSRSHLKELFEFNPDDDTGDDLALDTELPDSGVVLKHEAQQHARAYVASSSCASSTSNGRTAPSDGSESLVLAALFSGDNVTGVFRHDVLGSEETADRYARMSLRYAEGAAREQVAAALQRLQESAETASARTRTVAPHSSQLLNALRQRQQGSETQGIAGVDGHVERMARRIVEALSSGPVETERLIGMFPGVKDDAAYLFRDILHKVSVLKNHKWYLLKTFKTKQVPRE